MHTYKIECPACGKGNFAVTPGKVSYCFNCGYTEREGEYSAPKPSKHIPEFREIYKELAAYYHSCLQEKHRVYLNSRGIDDTEIERRMIGYCPASSHVLYTHPLARESGIAARKKPFLAERITFPYIYADKVTDIRGRALDKNSDVRYLSLMGDSITRGAVFAYGHYGRELQIITEGEIKSILADYVYPCIGLPGILSHKQLGIAEKNVICFDNQKEHRKELRRAIILLAERVSNPHIATLPLRKNEQKQDIDSFVLQYGLPEFKAVIDNAPPYTTWRKYVQ